MIRFELVFLIKCFNCFENCLVMNDCESFITFYGTHRNIRECLVLLADRLNAFNTNQVYFTFYILVKYCSVPRLPGLLYRKNRYP